MLYKVKQIKTTYTVINKTLPSKCTIRFDSGIDDIILKLCHCKQFYSKQRFLFNSGDYDYINHKNAYVWFDIKNNRLIIFHLFSLYDIFDVTLAKI